MKKFRKSLLTLILALSMIVTMIPSSLQVITAATNKPADGTTASQPYPSGSIEGITHYRIPAMITTNDGTIVTAADARWNNKNDYGGIDTIVSYSTDKGATWNYTFANYLGDNNKTYTKSSATFIDPVLTYDTDSNTIYMLVDLYVGGYAIATGQGATRPANGSGFTADGYLKVKSGKASKTPSDYTYYVKDGKIIRADGTVESEYTVDEYYNVKNTKNEIIGNLFYNDTNSKFTAYPTTYLYLTKSTDNGASWSTPQLLNLKNDSEDFYGVGPGNGIVTKNGTIMIPCYINASTGSSSQRASFIYSTDNGRTWKRSANATSSTWSSESQLVELSDGTIRMFFRNSSNRISYVDATGNATNGYTWGSVQTTNVTNHSNCQISAIKYSKKINGKEAILISCPTNTSSRKAGKIFVALVNDDKSLEFINETSVTTSTYQYSSLAELKDGNIGLLYENGDASIVYASYDIATLANGATIEAQGFVDATNKTLTDVSINLEEGSKTVKFAGLSSTQGLTVSSSDTSIASVSVNGDTITITPNKKGTAVISAVVGNARSIDNGSIYTLNVNVKTVSDALKGTITEIPGTVSYELDSDGIDNGAEYVIVRNNNALTNKNGETSTDKTSVTISNNKITSLNESNDNYVIWKFESNGSGYTIKNTAAYVWLSGNSVLTNNTNNITSLTVTRNNDTYTIRNASTSRYLYYGTTLIDWSSKFRTSEDSTNLSLYKKIVTSSTWNTDLTKLTSLINDANALEESIYTEETWNVLENALNAANAISTTTHTTQSAAQTAQTSVDAAAQTLYDAIAGLEKAPVTKEVTMFIGESVEETVEGTMSKTPNSAIAKATISGSTMTITGVTEGTTEIVVGHVTYKVKVEKMPDKLTLENTPFVSNTGGESGKAITKLTTSIGVSYDLNLNSKFSGKTVTWSSENTAIATVDANGNVTGKAVGETNIIARVDGATYIIPVAVIEGNKSNSGKYLNVFISEITDSKAYYSINCGTLTEVVEGEAIYVYFNSNDHVGIDFFAAPNEGYALTRMSATNANGDYYSINSTSPKNTDFYDSNVIQTTGGIFNRKTGQLDKFGETAVVSMIQSSINYGCDGALGFNRRNSSEGNLNSDLTFRSEKLPTIVKEVAGILGESGKTEDYREYVEGMTAQSGETVYFKITVTKYSSTDSITYSKAILTDNLEGATFHDSTSNTTSNTKNITDPLNDAGNNAQTFTYYVKYSIKDSDLDKIIKNTINFGFTYKSTYSSGSFNETANAEAKITATAFPAKNFVIDFSLPVNFSYDAWGASTVALKPGTNVGKAKYGTVDVSGNRTSGWTITYKPNTVLASMDTVTVYGTNGTEYTLNVYPATNVYYDETFAVYSGNWNKGSAAGVQQSAEFGQSGVYNYGCDDAYNAKETSTAKSTTSGNSAEFTFVGTGLDVYMDVNENSGIIMVMVRDSANRIEKMMVINTVKKAGTYDAALGLDDVATVSGAPVLTLAPGSLTHGEHTVTISQVGPGELILDGFRVYDTLEDADDLYALDEEANPVYTEFRDQVIKSLLSSHSYEGKYAEDIAKDVYNQIYTSSDTTNGAVVVSDPTYGPVEQTLIDDFIENSAKNELYLYPGQSLVFKANVDKIQLGARALDNAVNYKLNNDVALSGTLTSNTDMYYEINGVYSNGGYVYTITNTSAKTSVPSVIALTKLKYAFAGNATMMSLVEEDLYPAMRSLGFSMRRPVYADAIANITLKDVEENVVAETTLPVEGVQGETTTISAEALMDAIKAVLPEGYKIKDETSIKDVEVIFGESSDVNVVIEKIVATDTKAPGTGDTTNLFTWIGLLIASLGVILFRNKK